MNLIVRKETDPAVAAGLLRFVHEPHQKRHPELFKPYDFEASRTWFARVLAEENITCLVAFLAGEAVGYALLAYRKANQGPYHREDFEYVMLEQMSVREGRQGQGIGQRLLEEVCAFCRTLGVKRLELTVWADNERARTFYDRQGFEVYLERRVLAIG